MRSAHKSKEQFQAELNAPRRLRAGDDSEVRAVECPIRIVEIYEVEGIEKFCSELQSSMFRYDEILHDGGVEVVQRRSAQNIPARVTERERRGSRKGGRVKPARPRGIRKIRVTDQVGPLPTRRAGGGVIKTEERVHWLTAI